MGEKFAFAFFFFAFFLLFVEIAVFFKCHFCNVPIPGTVKNFFS